MKNIRIYTDEVDELAQKQIARLLEQPAFADAKVRIMPDVHAGKGCVIGFTADLGEKVIPNIVGVDIGCGMLTVHLGRQKPDFAALDAVMHRYVPSGMETHAEPVEVFEGIDALHCLPRLERVKRLLCSLRNAAANCASARTRRRSAAWSADSTSAQSSTRGPDAAPRTANGARSRRTGRRDARHTAGSASMPA